MADYAAWRASQTQGYTVEYYYVETPRYVRRIENSTQWVRDTVDWLTSRILAWCEARKTRVVWPDGTWGDDIYRGR